MNDKSLSHFDESGSARMVAVDDKSESTRGAVARARVRMERDTLERIKTGRVGKGDVLAIARIAAITGAKQTFQTIPLCHPVRLTAIDVAFEVHDDRPGIDIIASVRAVDRTGPEMEAMSAACTAALTIYDMCKSMDRSMVIEDIALLEKFGGKSGHWTRPTGPERG